MKNRVLSWDEVITLKVGQKVWVQELRDEFKSGINTVGTPISELDWGVSLEPPDGENFGPYWPETFPDKFGIHYRVWSLPQEPTPEEYRSCAEAKSSEI